MTEQKPFPTPEWTADTANSVVRSLESQFLAALACEYDYDIQFNTQEIADNTYQKTQNELYRLAHVTEPDENDVQHA